MVGKITQLTDSISTECIKEIEPAKTLLKGDISALDECQLQEDTEFLQSVLKELDGSRTSNLISDKEQSKMTDAELFTDQSSSSFTDYLKKKKHDFGVQVDSIGTSSNATSLRYAFS